MTRGGSEQLTCRSTEHQITRFGKAIAHRPDQLWALSLQAMFAHVDIRRSQFGRSIVFSSVCSSLWSELETFRFAYLQHSRVAK